MLRTLTCMAAALLVPVAVLAGPCATGAAAGGASGCAEWMALGSARSLVYTSHPLREKNPSIVRILVIVHDTERDARAAFDVGRAAALAAGVADGTLVVAPRFSSNDGGLCRDTLRAREINWPCVGDSWRSGGMAAGRALSSFDLMDEILRRAADRRVFSNVRAVVVAGHSAGAQFVTRYAMANRVHEQLATPVSYVVANPSSYAYLDETRPVRLQGRLAFRPFAGAKTCAAYDAWPYGLDDRGAYARDASRETLRTRAAARPTTYLLGGLDVMQDSYFDTSCAAMAQGSTRLERGEAFIAHLQKFGAHHALRVIPQCGHDARCVLTAASSLAALFPGSQQSSAPAAN